MEMQATEDQSDGTKCSLAIIEFDEKAFAEEAKGFILPIFPIPTSFLCPITRDCFQHPVIVRETGHSYEREAITKWLQHHSTCPLTNTTLLSKEIVPNFALRGAISEWQHDVLQSRATSCSVKCFFTMPVQECMQQSKEDAGACVASDPHGPMSSSWIRVLETGFAFDIAPVMIRFRKCATAKFARKMESRFGLSLQRVELVCMIRDHLGPSMSQCTQIALSADRVEVPVLPPGPGIGFIISTNIPTKVAAVAQGYKAWFNVEHVDELFHLPGSTPDKDGQHALDNHNIKELPAFEAKDARPLPHDRHDAIIHQLDLVIYTPSSAPHSQCESAANDVDAALPSAEQQAPFPGSMQETHEQATQQHPPTVAPVSSERLLSVQDLW